jgi:hypothetical protein
MHDNKKSRQQSYCRACGLVVVDLVCPFCSSTIDESVIYESKIGYRSRLTSITGVCLLIVAGVTPAVVSARESVETATITAETAVVSTTISTAPVMESTSTTLVQSSDKNTTQETKSPITQKPKKTDSSSSGSVYVGPQSSTSVYVGPQSSTSVYVGPQSSTSVYVGPQSSITSNTMTTTTVPSHGKTEGSTFLWKKGDFGLGVSVGQFETGEGSIAFVYTTFLNARNVYMGCMDGLPTYKYEHFASRDGGVTVADSFQAEIPNRTWGSCYANSHRMDYVTFSDRSWRLKGVAQPRPTNFYAKLKLTVIPSGEVVESPWVLVDWSKIP